MTMAGLLGSDVGRTPCEWKAPCTDTEHRPEASGLASASSQARTPWHSSELLAVLSEEGVLQSRERQLTPIFLSLCWTFSTGRT